ncbi:hypothetical protein A1OE_697 [Candidatus Endolissoclinum faulkneri L2]|uniref:Zinc finger CHCC-type domain-containing protein n=1 Tax=Candidatus Endolissoclinum faulkneri L2 TaxID=1193729 RepID=K7YH54_9PROT|nr:zinc-finger domain-containing protein [Candidatus Endolissoclinum faulkneri]AFX98885.1 hypothetical protein A1OE_697 [Candidatus Endolissoclinum faulkneri L2]
MIEINNCAFETIEVTGYSVTCDGGDELMGHPRIFLEIAKEKHKVICPYCSKTYVTKKRV